jgi:hypothetical protein
LQFKIIWEKARGLDFIQVLPPEDLGFDENLVYRGSPSGDSFLIKVLEELEIEPRDSILDIGCAKVSALRVMHKFPFQKIDGLEISQTLYRIAKSNFEKMNIKNITVYNLDARDFLSFKDYKYFYFYNPFPHVVMVDVISKLVEQVGSQQVFIIYNNPVCHEVISKSGFHKISEHPDRWGNGIYVYSTNTHSKGFESPIL